MGSGDFETNFLDEDLLAAYYFHGIIIYRFRTTRVGSFFRAGSAHGPTNAYAFEETS